MVKEIRVIVDDRIRGDFTHQDRINAKAKAIDAAVTKFSEDLDVQQEFVQDYTDNLTSKIHVVVCDYDTAVRYGIITPEE